jgi:hypothetical protein
LSKLYFKFWQQLPRTYSYIKTFPSSFLLSTNLYTLYLAYAVHLYYTEMLFSGKCYVSHSDQKKKSNHRLSLLCSALHECSYRVEMLQYHRYSKSNENQLGSRKRMLALFTRAILSVLSTS